MPRIRYDDIGQRLRGRFRQSKSPETDPRMIVTPGAFFRGRTHARIVPFRQSGVARMRSNPCIGLFICLGLSSPLLSHACSPRSPAVREQGASRAESLLPTRPAPDGGRLAAQRDSADGHLNPWSDAARDVLAQHCGNCHRGDLPTAVPGALAVFDLLENPWYGRLTPKQLDSILLRVRGTTAMDPADVHTAERFVRCAREGACERHDDNALGLSNIP